MTGHELVDAGETEAYIKRITGRLAFRKAHADQMAHFVAADKVRTNLK